VIDKKVDSDPLFFTEAKEIDAELVGWIKQAYQQSS
jgi:hypothetical protein